MATYDESREKLKAAMAKYGFTDADRFHWKGHITDSDANGCWCGADVACDTCESVAPCVHGADRPTRLIHKTPS
jgi:hypothetical protein